MDHVDLDVKQRRRTIWTNERMRVRAYCVGTGEIVEGPVDVIVQRHLSWWAARGETFRVEPLHPLLPLDTMHERAAAEVRS